MTTKGGLPDRRPPRAVRFFPDSWEGFDEKAQHLHFSRSALIEITAEAAVLGIIRCTKCEKPVPIELGNLAGKTFAEWVVEAEKVIRIQQHPDHGMLLVGNEVTDGSAPRSEIAALTAELTTLRTRMRTQLDRINARVADVEKNASAHRLDQPADDLVPAMLAPGGPIIAEEQAEAMGLGAGFRLEQKQRAEAARVRDQAQAQGHPVVVASELASPPAGTMMFREPGAEPVVEFPVPEEVPAADRKRGRGKTCPHRVSAGSYCRTCGRLV